MIGVTDATGAGGNGTLLLNLASTTGTVYSVGFQISTVSSQPNTNFTAELAAYDSAGNLLGTYKLNTNGTGGGGLCPGLLTGQGSSTTDPVPCNDAPFIGFTDSLGRIALLKVHAVDATGFNGFFIDTMLVNAGLIPPTATPEPAVSLMTGAGLIGLSLLARKLSARKE